MRNAKGEGSNISGRGLGETPQSWRFKLGIALVVFLIVLFIVMDFIDRANAKKKNAQLAPTVDMPIDWTV